MVCLISGATGLIMALQGGAELRKFGAMGVVINLVGTSMTRELGPLMAAIVVIGRSGSSISAEIGAMTVTEEIDACAPWRSTRSSSCSCPSTLR